MVVVTIMSSFFLSYLNEVVFNLFCMCMSYGNWFTLHYLVHNVDQFNVMTWNLKARHDITCVKQMPIICFMSPPSSYLRVFEEWYIYVFILDVHCLWGVVHLRVYPRCPLSLRSGTCTCLSSMPTVSEEGCIYAHILNAQCLRSSECTSLSSIVMYIVT